MRKNKKHSYKQRRMSKERKKLLTTIPSHALGVNVVDGDLGYALRTFKRKVKESGVLRELYDRQEFTKPSRARRKILTDAKFRNRKKVEANNEFK